ncbi:MAG: DUF87 domain-containing protein [Arenicellales bacterium]|nr:DUF87 domain-containing protein [Arenicellales bacterium]
MEKFDKLSTFYLGKSFDLARDSLTENLVLYDAKDLNTHAVIIGMTGSGKTGLGIGLLEEAALDKIPVIAIDPKGDLGNIMLTFPDLKPEDFEPWVNPREATDKGLTTAEYAKNQAQLWREGLGKWGQDKERIKRLRDTADMAIYTPGSQAGVPISVLRSFNAPPVELRNDGDMYRDRISSTATSILALMGIDADPLTSREHILISNILKVSWDEGRSLDIPGLITAIQKPPIEKVGVLDIDAFFPPDDRFGLAMRLNNLLAAPGFEVWMEGESLDAGRLFHTPAGRPRVSVMSIAHLSDSERMFFVTMLLNEVLSWMRRQPGTGTLRAIVYMDEIFGYMPPTANPPSKTLLLTLLKQARAYGLGLVLATQNPVDLDYKGLSNTGTWFIGRLQTERDKARVMDGLEGAASDGEFDRRTMERTLAGLGKRRFLLHNVHETSQVIFQTRWVMSYLAGPLTRDQIKQLMTDYSVSVEEPVPPATPGKAHQPVEKLHADTPPALSPSIPQFFFPVTGRAGNSNKPIYYPRLLGVADVAYSSAKYKVHVDNRVIALTEFNDSPVPIDWQTSELLDIDPDTLESEAMEGAAYAELNKSAAKAKNYRKWEKAFKRWVHNDQVLTLFYSKQYKAVSDVGEHEGDFRARLQTFAREQRDIEIGKLRKKYDAKIAVQERKLLRAKQKLETEQAQSEQSKLDAYVSIGSALLGAFMGRKRVSTTSTSRIGTAIKRASRIGKQSDDVRHAKEEIREIVTNMEELSTQFEEDVARLDTVFDAQKEELDSVVIKATYANIHIQLVGLTWLPYYQDKEELTPAWA